MSLVSPADLIREAPDGTGVAAFNIILTEHLEAFLAAAEDCATGLILQLSQNAVRYHGALAPMGRAIVQAARDARVPVAVQLDHADDVALVREAAALGFTSVMFDASRLPIDDNIAATAAIADELHRAGVWVEAELGEIGGKDGVHSPTARTDPAEAADFVSRTRVDGLAVAVGSSHAMTDRSATIDLTLTAALRQSVPVPLVLHGSSGVSDELIRAACTAGIRKVNIGTRFNIVFTRVLREQLDAHGEVVDPRRYLQAARAAVADDARGVLGVLGG